MKRSEGGGSCPGTVLLQVLSHTGADASRLQEAVDDGCVSGQLATLSSMQQTFMAKIPGTQTQSSLHKIFKHRRAGLQMIHKGDKQAAAVRNSLLTIPFLRFWLCLILLQSPFSMSN